MSKTILVVGGAGYIGSHTSYLLSQLGYKVVIIDKLLHEQPFNHTWADLNIADFADEKVLDEVFTRYKIDAVMHFAALIEIGISVKRPLDFYENNVVKTFTLLKSMLKHNVKKFIFSSSCAVYGNPIQIPINENHPYNPMNPYGKNKLSVEFALKDFSDSYNLNYVSLRYFNAAGASPSNNLGEQHNPETHIIPLMFRAIKNKTTFKVFGNNYKTKDGTCVRDYIHVLDIAKAHILALDYINKYGKSNFFNLGSEKGYSVKEMVDAVERICGEKMNVKICDRRDGDVDVLIADSRKAREILGWKVENSNLDNILKSAWEWETKSIFCNEGISRKNALFTN